MKKIKKQIVYILMMFLIIGNNFSLFAFADSNTNQEENKCLACGSTPTSMQEFINFEVELLGILQGASGIAESFGTNKTSGMFAGGLLSLPQAFVKSIIEKTKTDLDSELKAVRAINTTAVLLGIMTAESKESLYSLQILLKDEAFVRDYKILQELDMAINDIIWDMGQSGIWRKKVSSSVKNEIIGLQYKYSQMNGNDKAIFEMLSLSSDIKYSNLSMFLLRLNSFMKSSLMALGDNTPLLDLSVSRFDSLYSQGDMVAIINRDFIESIKIEYSCVGFSTCNKTVKQALKDLANVKNFTESFGRTKKTVKDANKNLKESLGTRSNYDGFLGWLKKDGTGGLTDKQVELLYTVYGLDAYNLTTSQVKTLKQNWKQIKKESQSVIDAYKDATATAKQTIDTTSSTLKGTVELIGIWLNKIKDKGSAQEKEYIGGLSDAEKQDLLQQVLWQRNIPIDRQGQLLIDNMQVTVNKILEEKGKDKNGLLVGVNQDTHYFVEIGGIIHAIVNNDIGDKNDDWLLVKTLGETCSYQCKNHGGKCYGD